MQNGHWPKMNGSKRSMFRLLSCYIPAMRPGVDEPERFLQDLFAVMEDRARGNEERLASELFGDKRQSHSSLNRSGQ